MALYMFFLVKLIRETLVNRIICFKCTFLGYVICIFALGACHPIYLLYKLIKKL